MRFNLKRWRLLVVALMAAFAVSVSSSIAFANEPGEGNNWQPEIANVTGSYIQSQDTASEAYGVAGGGTLVQIWRGYTDNDVWFAVNHGMAFNVPNASGAAVVTNVAPRVIYSNGWFYAFYTGTDGNILWSRVRDDFSGGAGNIPLANLAQNWSAWTILSLSDLHPCE